MDTLYYPSWYDSDIKDDSTMQLVTSKSPISLDQIKAIAKNRYGDLIKAVIDIEQEAIVLDADLHADQEAYLLERGSHQHHLWGINLYPEFYGTDDFIEFDSMINLRPSMGNMTRSVDDQRTQQKIKEIIGRLITL